MNYYQFATMKREIRQDPKFHVVADNAEKIEYYHLPSGRLLRVTANLFWTFCNPRTETQRALFLSPGDSGLNGRRAWSPFLADDFRKEVDSVLGEE